MARKSIYQRVIDGEQTARAQQVAYTALERELELVRGKDILMLARESSDPVKAAELRSRAVMRLTRAGVLATELDFTGL